MIVYLDASGIVKRYLAEADSASVDRLVAEAAVLGTSVISRAEVSAAIARAARMSLLARAEAEKALKTFRAEWADLIATPVTQVLVANADTLAWEYGLRGYDAVHLASALLWQEALGEPVTMATFDQDLWGAAQQAGMDVWPPTLENPPRDLGTKGRTR
jgi:predicted nucleic acid-binding protein